MVKKKYRGGLKVLLLLLFVMLFAMSSTCYARTTLTDNEAEYIWDYLVKTTYDDYKIAPEYMNMTGLNTASRRNTYDDSSYLAFKNWFNTNNTLDISNNTVFIFRAWSTNGFNINYGNFNMTNSDDLPYLYFEFQRSNLDTQTNWTMPMIRYYAIDDTHNSVPINIAGFHVNGFDSGTFEIGGYSTFTLTSNGGTLGFAGLNSSNSRGWSREYYSSNISALSNFDGIVSFCPSALSTVYSNFNGNTWSDSPLPYHLKTLYNNQTFIPENPNDPVPDSGYTGTITDDNGDVTGQIDLSGIQNGIGNINNSINTQAENIINNQNENTDKITESIDNLGSDITNTNTDVDVQDKFDDMISSTANVVDPTVNFFSWLLDNMRTVLNSTGNYNIEVTLFDKTYIIRSDFFVLPDGDLKTFLQLSFIGWFGWHVIKKIRYIVYAVQCVNISDALHQVDFNPDIL